VQGQLQRSKKPIALRGLNQNHNHDLKSIFKGATTKAGSAKRGKPPVPHIFINFLPGFGGSCVQAVLS
jgi:hypothetical protein